MQSYLAFWCFVRHNCRQWLAGRGIWPLIWSFLFCCWLWGIALTLLLAQPQPALAVEIELESPSAVLMEPYTGQILYEKNSHLRRAPASVTKLMTLVVACEALEAGRVKLTDVVIASENAARLGGSQIYLEPGEKMSLRDLLIAIAVGSANDACVAVAEHIYGSHEEFVAVMNQRAQELGMKDTHFVNAYGLPAEGHYTSAYDMAILGRYALRFPFLLELTSIKEHDLRGGEFHLYNTNKLLWWYEGADGFKTGWASDAQYCLAATAERNGLRLLAVTMGAPRRHGNFRDCMKLFNLGFARYAYKLIAAPGQVCGQVAVPNGEVTQVDAICEDKVGALVSRGQEGEISWRCELLPQVPAPVTAGQKLGELVVLRRQEEIMRADLVADRDVEKCSFPSLVKRFLLQFAGLS